MKIMKIEEGITEEKFLRARIGLLGEGLPPFCIVRRYTMISFSKSPDFCTIRSATLASGLNSPLFICKQTLVSGSCAFEDGDEF